jgi:tellurite methyltransferase
VPPIARPIAYTPQPFLAQVISLVEASLSSSSTEEEEEEEEEGGMGQRRWTCCDVGCGSGRDAVWLAKRGRWTVRAVDRLPKCLARARQLGARHGVEGHVECEEAVIKAGVVVSSSPYPAPPSSRGEEDTAAAAAAHVSFDQQQYDLVVVIRFLEREFFGALKRMVRPAGGHVLFVSFLDRSEDGIVYESPKDPRRLLQPGELARVFGEEDGFEVVRDEVCRLPDGRFVNALLARRRGV